MGEFFYNLRVERSSNYNLEVIKSSRKHSLGLFISVDSTVVNSLYLFIFGCARSSWLRAGFSVVPTVGGYSSVVLCRPLTVGASPVAEHRL